MIEIRNGLYQLDDFRLTMDFRVPAGAFVAVVGPSGAGKSTLLNVVAGFEDLVSGEILLAGAAATRLPPESRPVSAVFQDNNSFAHLSARDNVALGISPRLSLADAEWTTVDAALARTGISHLASRRPGDMSGGERQRIALARVLVRQRPILLLDEAFAALGPALRRDMLQLVKSLQQEHQLTVLMVTHQPEDASEVADSVMFVDAGEVRAPLQTAAFFASTDKVVRAYLGS